MQLNATCTNDGQDIVSGCLACAGPDFADLTPAPRISDRIAWNALGAGLRASLVADAAAATQRAWPDITENLYRRFSVNGNRVAFEDAYFGRRRKLNALVIGEAIENKGRFLAEIEAGIRLICTEDGWQLPAHNSQTRSGAIASMPDKQNPVVDLFAAETAAQLAVASAVLCNVLSLDILRLIDRENAARVLQPYLAKSFWWTGLLGGRMNNWTVWCSQNVLIAAFARPYPNTLRRKITERAAFSLDAFLAEYGEDGACREGAFYYKHAALCLFSALDVLNSVTGNGFASAFETPKIRNIAEYILLPHIAGPHYANFGDAAAVMPHPDARVFRFGKAVGSLDLINFAVSEGSPPYDLDDINLYDRLQALFVAQQVSSHKITTHNPREGFARSIGMFVARDDNFYVAANAGNNGGDHGHNDVGNVIVYKNGKPVLIDVGVESYTAKTFSPARYEIWTMQSSFHNLPDFAGQMQRHGAEFSSRNVRTKFDAAKAVLEMDLAPAYAPEAQLNTYKRRVQLDRGKCVEISDQYTGALPATLNLMLAERPEISENTLQIGANAQIQIEGAARIEVEEIAISDARLHASWPAQIYRVRIALSGNEVRLVIR